MFGRGGSRWLAGIGLGALLVLWLEVTAWGALQVVRWKAPDLVYDPPVVTRTEFESYLEKRDPALGWTTRPAVRDASGARVSPAFPAPGGECVTVYGDSFVYADEVEHEAAWPDVLARMIGCRVGNFGVGGYGTDQALLRFERNADDRSPVTLLGIYPDNVMRNVNRLRYFLSGGSPLAFKPRFLLAGGEIGLLPLPEPGLEEVNEILARPAEHLDHESFLPQSPWGPQRVSFPYTASLTALLQKARVRNWLTRRRTWMDFFEAEHPARAVDLTIALAGSFAARCETQGRRCAVLLVPDAVDYRSRANGAAPLTASLRAGLEAAGVPFLDLAEGLAVRLGSRDYCELLSRADICDGHYTAEGYRLVAELVRDDLLRRGWVEADGR